MHKIGTKLKKWSTSEISTLISTVKDAGTDRLGFKKAATILNRTVDACSAAYYIHRNGPKASVKQTVVRGEAKLSVVSNKPAETIKLPGLISSSPITIRSGNTTITVVNGKVTITT